MIFEEVVVYGETLLCQAMFFSVLPDEVVEFNLIKVELEGVI